MSNDGRDVFDVPTAETLPERQDAIETPGLLLQGADENWVKALEKTAQNAERIVRAINKTMVSVAQTGDWVVQGDKCGLCSHGAERLLKFFPMTFFNWKKEKQEWTDNNGEAYRWIFSCDVAFPVRDGKPTGSVMRVEGRYSTRDKFHGYANQKWRPLHEIDESDIMAAARHICIGEGIKAHLGLRNIPKKTLEDLGIPLDQVGSVSRRSGTQGGQTEVSEVDKAKQAIIWEMAYTLCNNNQETAEGMIVDESAFVGKNNKEVKAKSSKMLKGKWLDQVFGKVKAKFTEELGEDNYEEICARHQKGSKSNGGGSPSK